MITSTDAGCRPPRFWILAAFATIYLVWGSTYLGIRFAVETLPPFLMGGVRFVIAGSVLYLWLRGTGTAVPSASSWKGALIAGILLFGIGNGTVNWAEQKVPSGLAALIIAGTPVWFALFDRVRPGGSRPTIRTTIGITVGFAGVGLLAGSRSVLEAGSASVPGILALIFASMAWAIGSLYTKYTARPESPLMTAAQQMLSGGVILLFAGLLLGETRSFVWSQVSAKSLAAFVYLTLFGSLVAFSAYTWLLKVTTPARISTYAYVNPVIAVLLGCLFGGETLTGRMALAAGIIVLGVVIITARRTVEMPVIAKAPAGQPQAPPVGSPR